jgi:hypothetical protein
MGNKLLRTLKGQDFMQFMKTGSETVAGTGTKTFSKS